MERLAYGIEEGAEAIGIRPRLFAELVATGRVASFKVGRRRLVSAEALRAYIAQLEREASEKVPA